MPSTSPSRPSPASRPPGRPCDCSCTPTIVKRVLNAPGRSEPAVILLEDLHWFDAASEGVLEALVEGTPGTRTLVVVNFRPEYHAAWVQRSYYRQLPLLPLGPEACAELLRDLLGRDPSLARLAQRIRERTGGNPFFIEETVQALPLRFTAMRMPLAFLRPRLRASAGRRRGDPACANPSPTPPLSARPRPGLIAGPPASWYASGWKSSAES